MTNPISGHTAATGFGSDAQGLRDGDGLTSASLTNIYEGIHGNGIVRLEAGATGHALRKSIISGTPGFVEQGPSGSSYVKVYGGYCVLDSTMYKFAGGTGSSEEIQIGVTANYSGTLPSPPSSASDVFVVIYIAGNANSEKHLMYEMGTPVATSVGTPLIPNSFLTNPSTNGATNLNHQSTILAVLRYSMAASQANIAAALSTSAVIHDRRAYVRTPPLYLTPMTKGAVGDVADGNNVDAGGVIDTRFASPENGDFSGSTFGAIWQTHNEGDDTTDTAAHSVLLYAAPRDLHSTPVTHTHRLGPDQISILTASKSFTFDQANVFLVNPNGGSAHATLTPNGTFPPGHRIEITNISTANNFYVKFTAKTNNATAAEIDITNAHYAKFINDGTSWHLLSVGDSNEEASDGDITQVIAGTGMTGGAAVGIATLNVIGGDGITANADDVAITPAQTTITSIHATDLIIGEDSQTAIDFGTADEIDFKAANAVQLTLTDGVFRPETTNDIDLGTASKQFKDAYIDGTLEADAITINGTAIASVLSPVAGHASIATVGTIGTGTWQGTAIASGYIADNAITLAKMASGTDGNIISYDASGNPVAIATGNDGQVLTSTGAGSPPAFEAIAALGTITTGVWQGTAITVPYGGTGATSLTDGGILLGSGTGAVTAMTALSDGQMIVGDGTTDPVAESGVTLRASIGCNPVAGSASITTLGTIGTGVWNATVIASAKMASASATAQGAVELATSAETNTGTDATRAVTPDGLEDWEGSAQVTTLGTIATGVWQGTVVAEAYLPNASATAQGVAELATSAETITGTDAARVVTPDGLADWTGGNSAVTKLGTIATGVWQGTKVASAYLDDDTAHLAGTQTFTGTKTLNSFKGTAGATVTNILDEDAMGSNSATALATQQSIKAYADTKSVIAGSASITTVGTIGTGTWAATDVAVAHGGTGASTLTDGGVLLGSGTGAITAMAVLTDGQMIVGDGTTDPVAESGTTLRTSIGVGTGDSPQLTGIELGHATDTTLTRSAAGILAVEGSIVKTVGKESIWVPAAAMYPNTTAGCSALTQVELSNGPELKVLDFDKDTDEHAQFTVAFPKSWDAQTVTYQAFWTVVGTDNGTVKWEMGGISFGNSDDQNVAFGTVATAAALAFSTTASDLMMSAESGAMTIAGVADDAVTYFQINRDIGGDDNTGDARLVGVKIYYTTNATNDA